MGVPPDQEQRLLGVTSHEREDDRDRNDASPKECRGDDDGGRRFLLRHCFVFCQYHAHARRGSDRGVARASGARRTAFSVASRMI